MGKISSALGISSQSVGTFTEEIKNPHGGEKDFPRRRKTKLRKNEMKLPKSEMKLPKNLPFPPWKIPYSLGRKRDDSGGGRKFGLEATHLGDEGGDLCFEFVEKLPWVVLAALDLT